MHSFEDEVCHFAFLLCQVSRLVHTPFTIANYFKLVSRRSEIDKNSLINIKLEQGCGLPIFDFIIRYIEISI